ncbi:hypothetical protein D3C73_1511620 [compost metagenome]
MHAFLPEAGDFHQHLQAVLAEIGLVSGVIHIVIDCISNGAVAVNLFECNLPLVVALFAVHRYHWIQRAFFEAELAGVFLCLLQMFVTVDQQVAGNRRIGST